MPINVPQGTINKGRGTLTFLTNPQLSVIPQFLGKGGITIRFPGDAIKRLSAMVSSIKSYELYREVEVEIMLLKTNGLGAAFVLQETLDGALGDAVFRSDTAGLLPYYLNDLSMAGENEVKADGESADFKFMLKGYYPVNNATY